MKNISEKRILLILILASIGIIFNSCEDTNSLDFENSWIKFHRYENDLDASETVLSEDTIIVSLGDNFIIRVKTQSNDGSEPRIYKQLDNNEIEIITNIPGEATMESNFREENGYRQINKIYLSVSEVQYSTGQVIKYEVKIGSKTGEINDKVYIVIK